MIITVCQQNGGYGNIYCKKVAQETFYSVPVLTIVELPIDAICSEPIKNCVKMPISLSLQDLLQGPFRP